MAKLAEETDLGLVGVHALHAQCNVRVELRQRLEVADEGRVVRVRGRPQMGSEDLHGVVNEEGDIVDGGRRGVAGYADSKG